MKNRIIISSLLLFVLMVMSGQCQIVYKPPEKKLIDFGWNSPHIRDYTDNRNFYESGPFDGLTLKISKGACGGNVFMVNDWLRTSKDSLEAELNLVKSPVKSSRLTDNFIVIYGASQMDWFSDDDWALAEDQLRFAAGLAKTAGCKGVVWDPEPYKPGKNPWRYKEQENPQGYTFEQYWHQVRKRGGQFIHILQAEFPGITVLSLRELSDWQKGSPFSGGLLPVTDRKKTIGELAGAWWGLHPAFYAGILDSIAPGTELIDANEEAYYYTTSEEFYEIGHILRDDAKALVPPGLWNRHSCFNRLGHAISADYIAGNWLGISPFPYRLSAQGLMMTPGDRAKWFEHNAYYALRTSDGYAWLYTEDMNWWTGENVPEGFREALLRARDKVQANRPLGFEISEIIQAAQEKAEEIYKNKGADGFRNMK